MTIAAARPVKVRKKLIEVALPLEAINIASAREKSIRHGHPSTLHLWWARRPLAAARAVIFSQMVDDPSEYVDTLRDDPKLRRRAETALKARLKLWEEAKDLAAKAEGTGLDVPEPGPEPTLDEILADQERQRLFRIIEDLVLWENTTNETVLQSARDEIWASWRRTCLDNVDHPRAKELFDRHKLPAFHDPFAGGGALPLEAQRLGLEAYASDLNPVAVLINKAMIEIPPKFAGRPPVNPKARSQTGHSGTWTGAQGLAEDVRYYGQWMRDEAEKRIGHLYPKVEVTAEMARERPDLKPYVGRKLTMIAWLWARTVKSPNPAFAHVDVPLASTFMLSTKVGKEAYVEPVIEDDGYRFTVKVGKPRNAEAAKNGTKLARANFRCVLSGTPISGDHIKAEGRAGRMGARLMAIVADGDRGRIYLTPTEEHELVERQADPVWRPDMTISGSTQYVGVRLYGMDRFDQIFTSRQLAGLTALSNLIENVRDQVIRDTLVGRPIDRQTHLADAEREAKAYADGVITYLSLGVSKLADYNANLVQWSNARDQAVHVFGRQAFPMVWDYAEVNMFAGAAGDLVTSLSGISKVLDSLPIYGRGQSAQGDAAVQTTSRSKVVSTDPPYYDNVPYADLSDFFYVWLRRSLQTTYPELFSTIAVPKDDELVAFAYRHEGRAGAEAFFLEGMTQAMQAIADEAHPAFPVTIYYAFKQAETLDGSGFANTGWETFIESVIRAGFVTSGTWPMRTEKPGRMRENDSNALASSIIMVCRKRDSDTATVSRREFVATLRVELPLALANLQHGNIAPVDLAQAAIGPGMAAFTRYAKVLDASGEPLTVREAIALINATLDEALTEQEGDFDADSRWALAWYEQFGFDLGPFGVAETLSTAKNTSVLGMVSAGIVSSRSGQVRLLKPIELDSAWDPTTDARRPAWQTVHQLVLAADRGEQALVELLRKLGPEAEVARELAYRLYVLSDRKKRPEEAAWYNGLVQAWPEIARLVIEDLQEHSEQGQLFGGA